MQTYKNRRSITTVNNHLPFVWRVNYLHEAPAPESARDRARKGPPNFAEEPFSDGRRQRS